MRCSKCKGDTGVLQTIKFQKGKRVTKARLFQPTIDHKDDVVVRLRQCKKCSHKFYTGEMEIEVQ